VSGYECKDCGAPAAVDAEGAIVRTCEHAGTIVACMSAVAYGRGGMRESHDGPIVAFLRALGRRLMEAVR